MTLLEMIKNMGKLPEELSRFELDALGKFHPSQGTYRV